MRKILLRKRVRAHLEYLRILFLEFKVTLLLAGAVLLSGSLLFHFLHVDPATGLRRITWMRCTARLSSCR